MSRIPSPPIAIQTRPKGRTRRVDADTWHAAFAAATAEVLGFDDPEQLPPLAATADGEPSYVVDRHGRHVRPRFDNITQRIESLCSDPAYGDALVGIDAPLLTQQVVGRFRSGMSTREIDSTIVGLCDAYGSHSPDYLGLAARICVSDLHKRSPESPLRMIEELRAAAPERFRFSDEYCGLVARREPAILQRLRSARDFRFTNFGFQTFAYSYLQRSGDKCKEGTLRDEQVMERPQHLYMRVAIFTFACRPDGAGHLADDAELDQRLATAFDYYDLLSAHKISHASSTFLNAGMKVPQLSSCFLTAPGDDLESLLDLLKTLGMTSKWSGGISTWLSNVRARGAPIRKTNGTSQGIWRYIRILNELQDYVDQGGNRPGAFAVYLAVWHADTPTFLEMPLFEGRAADSGMNAPSLKYGLVIYRCFVKAVLADDWWYLMCPFECPGLSGVSGKEFETLYLKYVGEGRYRKKVKAREIMDLLLASIQARGFPYIVHHDNMNALSNMNNVGNINSSNLCGEIVIPSWSNFDAETFGKEKNAGEFGVCTLNALCLESFLVPQENGELPKIDFSGIVTAASISQEALDNIIDLNFYTSVECRRSSLNHRPTSVGIMGLADVFARLRLVYGEPAARELDRAIAAAIDYGTTQRSIEMGKERGNYSSFVGSPASRGLLSADMWSEQGFLKPGWEQAVTETIHQWEVPAYDDATGERVATFGKELWDEQRAGLKAGHLRNAYRTGYMPTATTSQIIGQNECFEPYTSNIYTRHTQAGEFMVVSRHLMAELRSLGLWNDRLRRVIIAAGGSIQGVAGIPDDIKRRFKTVREMDQRVLTIHAAARAPFVTQSMSLNYYFHAPTMKDLLTLVKMGDELGLKTISYYVHSAPAADTMKSSVLPEKLEEKDAPPAPACSMSGDCASCKL